MTTATKKPWLVYLLCCSDATIYTGITNNLVKRLDKHNNGTGAKYTRSRRPVKLLASFEVATKSAALKLEHRIKKLNHSAKLQLGLDKRLPMC